MEETICSEEPARSVSGAEALISKHNEHKAEIDAREDSVAQVSKGARKLIQQSHYASAEVPLVWVIGLLPGWVPGCVSGWVPGCVSGCISGWVPGCVSGCISGWVPGCVSGCVSGWVPGCVPGCVSGCISGWVPGCVCEWEAIKGLTQQSYYIYGSAEVLIGHP